MADWGTGLSDESSVLHKLALCHSKPTRLTTLTTPSAVKAWRQRGARCAPARAQLPRARRKPTPRVPSGINTGNTKRVVSAEPIKPATENKPNCASPAKPENTRAKKPHTEVSSPRRTVGQPSRTQCRQPWPAGSPSRPRAWMRK